MPTTGPAYRRCEFAWANGHQIGVKVVVEALKNKRSSRLAQDWSRIGRYGAEERDQRCWKAKTVMITGSHWRGNSSDMWRLFPGVVRQGKVRTPRLGYSLVSHDILQRVKFHRRTKRT